MIITLSKSELNMPVKWQILSRLKNEKGLNAVYKRHSLSIKIQSGWK